MGYFPPVAQRIGPVAQYKFFPLVRVSNVAETRVVMKKFPYSVVKKDKLDAFHQQLSNYKLQVSGATEFVKAIEQGNLDIPYDSGAEADGENALASSLVSMRDQMKKFSAEERQRNWVSEGLAKFVDILRSKNNDIAQLSNEIISQLVKYLNANQGALYIVNDDDKKDVYLEMAACYAYNRQKFLTQRFELGEGIIGQVVLEKITTYLKNIPKDYIRITSGLGDGLPRNLLIVPLKIEERVFGLVEIASFSEIKNYQIEFVERLGESIASTISAAKVSASTQKLLQESQAQAEQMRSQEEEMRQNMEELSATQEEMHRVMKEMQGKERYMTDLINASKDSILTVDQNMKVINCNRVFKATYSGSGMDIDKGFDISNLFSTQEEKARYRALYKRVFAGETFDVTDHYKFQGLEAYYIVTYSPIRNDQGEILAAAVFVKDVTEITRARDAAQQQTEELKAQEEELRQNMEELSATQEEMQRVLTEVQNKEKYLLEVLNATNDSIFTMDRDYRIIGSNKVFSGALEAMGLKAGKGFEMLSLFADDAVQREQQKAYYDRALAGEHFEVSDVFTTNGVKSYYMNHYSPIRDGEGKIYAIACYAKDMTALMTAQHENAEMRQTLEVRENVFGVTTILSEADLFGNIIFVNDKLCEVSKYSREELIGKPHNIFRHPEMPKELFKEFWATLKKGDVFRGIIKNKAKDGSFYWVDAAIVPVKDAAGNVVKYVGARYPIEDEDIAVLLYNRQAKKMKLPLLAMPEVSQ
jgi:PAS domain S-box-containing protein